MATLRCCYCSTACKLKAYRQRKARQARSMNITGFIVEDRTRGVIARAGLERHVIETAQIVDSKLAPGTRRGGAVIYEESIENPEDWEIVVVSKLAVSRQDRFELSLRIGGALSQHIGQVSRDPLWTHVTFRLELA